ncbi:DUF397 domain-containing protein [Streptomyces sp. NPDC090442]|uniref:DUF397 domain-containing protein n=1 Tax=Streptomyces sp. NPDC090442 TaxID=3365962 RepID=UPI0038171506
MSKSPNWHKSSYSSGGANDCVEVATNMPRVLVRDTKLTESPVIGTSQAAWAGLVEFARQSDV